MEFTWDDFVTRHPRGHLLQTSDWGALKGQFGWEAQLVTWHKGDALAAGAQVLYRWLPGGRFFSVAYVPRGPVVDWDDPAAVRAILSQLTAEARKHRAIFVRIEPGLAEEERTMPDRLLGEMGFHTVRRTIQPRRTVLVDISGGEDGILGRMKQKTRYNIRLAGRKGVVVRLGGRDDLPAFTQLVQVTGGRQDFGVHSPAYFRAAYDQFSADDRVGLLLAEYEGRPLAGLMVFALGETAWYLYGASSDEERQRMPAYLLQWEAMRWARAKGCTHYDLWGVPDEDEETLEAEFLDRSDGLWGVYRFKRGFGGRLIRWAGAYDRVFNRPLYWLFGKLTG
jgi:peptidoglycan pentaglycine glycine transferase (the first glycine)